MKGFLFIFSAFIVATLLAFRFKRTTILKTSTASVNSFKKKNVVRCSVDWNALSTWFDEVDIPPMPGAGTYKWKINTKSDSAQFYFNQGINMYYSFHIIEAMASFKKAARFDGNCAMFYWAQALTYGPNINDLGYAASPEALTASEKAIELSKGCNEKEMMLIKAQSIRYSADSMQSRTKLNQDYVDKMKEAYEKFPDDANIATLYADALMLQHPWDLWNIDGTPKPWTPLIEKVLERSLKNDPNNPGTNHYYIHVMEASPYAYKALTSANRLGKLTPGLSHTVHMPSHIYLRTGEYNKGVLVNEKAIASYKRSIPLYAPVTGADFLYIIHNLHMQTNNAMLAGRKAYSVRSAVETVNSIPKDYLAFPAPMGSTIQYIYATPLFVDIRFARWDELLQRKQPDASEVYANVLYHFARGIAFSNKQNFTEASKELDQMRENMKDSSLTIPLSPFSAAIEGAKVAEQILLGVIHEKRKLNEGAIHHYALADSIESHMVYNEPRDWLLNPKHYLGNAYLIASEWKEAETVFKKDLTYNSENVWALYGLYQSLKAQKKQIEADRVLARFKKASAQADIKITAAIL
jgi:tetratricopeptide (TPR) repeat protein